MTTETMTVHKALAELKVLDKRIRSAISEVTYVTCAKKSNTKIGGVPIEDYERDIVSKYQKVNDLIARQSAIKRAVVLSNATTKVVVCDIEFTVAEAIEMKTRGVQFKKELMRKLSRDFAKAKSTTDHENSILVDARADEYVRNMYGNSDMKGLSEDAKKTRDDFIEAQTMRLVDPIDVSAEIDKLDDWISKFDAEVDSALSVSNAITELTIEY